MPKIELPENICFLSAMQALSSDQLIDMIRQIINDHPDIEKVIRLFDRSVICLIINYINQCLGDQK